VTEPDIETIEEEIFGIRLKLGELRRKMRETESEVERAVAERESIHAKIRQIKEENKATLDRVKQLRTEAREIRDKLAHIFGELKKKAEERKVLRERLSSLKPLSYTEEELERRIHESDEMIQTRPMRPGEEKKLFEEARRLSRLLTEVRKRNNVANQLRALSDEAARMREEVHKLKAQLEEKSMELDQHREALGQVRAHILNLKEEADKHHQVFLEKRKDAQLIEAERILLSSRLTELQDLVRKVRASQAKSREVSLKEKIRLQAIEKVNSGGKLTFDEMKVLLEDEDAWQLVAKKAET